ncbi:MAG: electron transport complex subunit E [Lachnospiraceae bacterium]|nr:electron transport complex subunit E [Lachnospiraceae bacterium]
MNKIGERLYNGIIKENPTYVLMLGMCPTLAVTTSAINGIGMGLSTTLVLVMSNMLISALRKVIPDKVRMPAFIVVVASFVTIVQFLVQGFLPSLYDALGIYIPLIVVNCIILGRAESYASKNPVIPSIFDGLGMGLGFTIGITIIGAIRELIGSGAIFGYQLLPLADESTNTFGYTPVSIFILAPGAFLVLGFVVAIMNKIRSGAAKRGVKITPPQGCLAGDCASCANKCSAASDANDDNASDEKSKE